MSDQKKAKMNAEKGHQVLKEEESRVLHKFENVVEHNKGIDPRCVSIAKRNIETAFVYMHRALDAGTEHKN